MLMGDPHRQCKHCGAVQKKVTEHAWMRVTGHRWLPLIGRCAEVNDPSAWNVFLNGEQKASVKARHHSEAVLEAREALKLIDGVDLEVLRTTPAPVKKRVKGATGPRVHKYNYWITANPIMPEHVREEYRREGLNGTICGYVRPKTTTIAAEVNCTHCLRLMAKAEMEGKCL
jgi:hypothetical protein